MTFTYVVTNTGDTTLFDVTVEDNVLGGIGLVETLEPGDSAEFTKTMLVASDSETVNIATAEGTDVLGETVTDEDDAEIGIVAAAVMGIVLELPAELPRTGFPINQFAFLGLALLVGGLALQLIRRRRYLSI